MGMPLTHRRFTVDEYHRMADAGILAEDERVELLDGQIVPMSPIGSPHAGCVNRLTRLLTRSLGDRAVVSVQNPVILNEWWEPEPDLAVLGFRADGYSRAHPGPADIRLVIEVMDSSTEKDRRVKLPAYARALVAEVWLVNLPAERIDVYQDPTGDRYATRRIVGRGAGLTPLGLPDVVLPTDEILG
jgi:Uma2 family endonuclease